MLKEIVDNGYWAITKAHLECFISSFYLELKRVKDQSVIRLSGYAKQNVCYCKFRNIPDNKIGSYPRACICKPFQIVFIVLLCVPKEK